MTQAGPISDGPGILAITVRKECSLGATLARLSLPNEGRVHLTEVSVETNEQ